MPETKLNQNALSKEETKLIKKCYIMYVAKYPLLITIFLSCFLFVIFEIVNTLIFDGVYQTIKISLPIWLTIEFGYMVCFIVCTWYLFTESRTEKWNNIIEKAGDKSIKDFINPKPIISFIILFPILLLTCLYGFGYYNASHII